MKLDRSTDHAVPPASLGPCPADVTQDGCINVSDLNAVIAAWGGCPVAVICYADVNGDCTVNVNDLLAVINAWCYGPGEGCCTGCPDDQDNRMGEPSGGGSSGPPTASELIEQVLQSSQAASVQAEIIQQILEHF